MGQCGQTRPVRQRVGVGQGIDRRTYYNRPVNGLFNAYIPIVFSVTHVGRILVVFANHGNMNLMDA